MRTKKLLFIMGLLLFTTVNYAQRDYVNKEWDNSTGNIGAIKRAVSAIDNDKNLIVVSNALNSSNNTDVLITKYAPDGALLWQQTYNGSGNGNDYGVQLKINNTNEIFVAAALQGNTSLDFGVLKYAPNGTLVWANTWNGQASGMDIPADLDIDDSGDIYLVGGSESPNTFSDYAIVKFNANGQYLWHTTYDYANLHDAATSLAIHTNTLVVSGASASTLTSWDYATLEIKKGNGDILNEKRTTVQGVGLDNVVAVTSDGNNNTYITGYTEENGNKNIQTLKINSNFDLEWVKNFDGGLEDVAKAIGIDNFGNVYIVGTKENNYGGKDYITIKYDQNGAEIWNREFGSSNSNIKAEAENLAISNNGNIIITGTVEDGNSNKEFATLKYSSDGKLGFIEKFDAGSQENEAKSIVLSDDNIYVTGITKIGGVNKNTTVKYKNIERKIVPAIIDGVETYVQDEIIVHFDESSLNLSAINRKSFVAGSLEQFVKPQLISQLNDSTNFNWSNLKTYKIHKGATSYDTLSTTRLGDTISLTKFWNSLIIQIPKSQQRNSIIHQIKTLDGIRFAQFNYIYSPSGVPDDSLFNDYQLGFYPNSIYPNSDINVLGAWDFIENKGYSIGSSNVKVGVYDYLIDYTHTEFQGSNGVGNSKVMYGKNYYTGNSIEDSYPQNTRLSHGTLVAGIIAANRNDEKGIAGIAGGNLSSNPSSTGVELYSYGIHWLDNKATSDIVAEAITEGSLETNTGYGDGVNIANHSYGVTDVAGNLINYPDLAVRNALKESWRNATVNIASRGNRGTTNPREFPACYTDDWVINVAASGTDGNRKTINNGDSNDWESSYGLSANNPNPACYIDVMAPGVVELISSTVNDDYFTVIPPTDSSKVFFPTCDVPVSQNNNKYYCFRGTSAATAHVTGVASLMYSVHDPANNYVYANKLTTEDIEHILEKTTFKIPNDYSHYDGYGLVNAEEAIKQVTLPYLVYHKTFTLDNADVQFITESTTSTPIYTQEYIPGPITDPNSGAHIIGGPYSKKKKYRARWVINYSPPEGQIIDWWKVNARIYGGQIPGGNINNTPHNIANDPIFIEDNLIVDSINNIVTGTVDAYFYEFIKQGTNQSEWLPFNPQLDLRYTLALHIKGDADLGIENEDEFGKVIVYPNPSGSEISIKNLPQSVGKYNLQFFDAAGRLIETKEIINSSNKINVSGLSKGLYYLRLENDSFQSFTKFIKK